MRPVARQSFRPFVAGLVFCLAVVSALVAQVIVYAALPNDVAQWTCAFLTPCFYVVAVFVGGRADGTDVVAAFGLKRAPRLWQIGIVIPLALACIAAFLPLAAGVEWVFGQMGYHSGPSYADYTSSWGNMLLALVAMALLPALGEEAMCRGMAMDALRQKGTYFGIFASALLFALWHGNPVQLVHQFLIGVVMAVLVHFSRTLWTSVLFHFCNNAFVIVYGFVYTQAGWTYTIPWWAYFILFVVGMPLVVVLLWLYVLTTVRRTPPREGAMEEPADATSAERLRRVMDIHGQYTPYIKGRAGDMATMYAAFGVVAMLWLLNTISGWVTA